MTMEQDTGCALAEVRVLLGQDGDAYTHAYVLLLLGDGGDPDPDPTGPQGWHHKAFPAEMPLPAVLEAVAYDDPADWEMAVPPDDGEAWATA